MFHDKIIYDLIKHIFENVLNLSPNTNHEVIAFEVDRMEKIIIN